MAAPAHYLAEQAEKNAKEYTYEWVQNLQARLDTLEKMVNELSNNQR